MNEADQDPETLDSIELLREAQAGGMNAFDRLFERYYGRVRGVVRRRLGAELRRSFESTDVLHEALIEAIRSFDQYEIRSDARLMDWFAGIVENRIRALVRRGRAAKRDRGCEVAMDHIRNSMSTGHLKLEPLDGETPPDERAEDAEQAQILGGCLEMLEPRYRQVILLRLYEGASWQEVADATGTPSSDAARMMYAKARIELSKLIKRHRGDAPS